MPARMGVREGEERDAGEKPSNNTELLLCLTFFHGRYRFLFPPSLTHTTQLSPYLRIVNTFTTGKYLKGSRGACQHAMARKQSQHLATDIVTAHNISSVLRRQLVLELDVGVVLRWKTAGLREHRSVLL